MNTHSPSPHAGEGLFDWLRNREPRWASLAIVHRLDKETSGVMVFAKSQVANRSLTAQFTAHEINKTYVLVTDRPVPLPSFTVKSCLVRAGARYLSRPLHAGGNVAQTSFSALSPGSAHLKSSAQSAGSAPRQRTDDLELGTRSLEFSPEHFLLAAQPLTGRTHQIRVHAAARGFPILGDVLYGGTRAPRVYLHSAQLTLTHPATGERKTFRAEPHFEIAPTVELRQGLIEPELTNAFRLIHGAGDNLPGAYVDRFGDYLLSMSGARDFSPQPRQTAETPERGTLVPSNAEMRSTLSRLLKHFHARAAFHKLSRPRSPQPGEASQTWRPILGELPQGPFTIRENGLQFELRFDERFSPGLFLDQRDNRRRLLTGYVAPGFSLTSSQHPDEAASLLNTFAYTCAFSVCAAKAGFKTTSLDLSKRYLEWGKRNFALNQLDASRHDFIFGEVFDWLPRLAKKDHQFDLILLDPPTFSQSKTSGVFRAEKDYGKLVAMALSLLKPGGVLFASTNAATWAPHDFIACVEEAVRRSRRKIVQSHYAPQPPDFPISRDEPAHLKTLWLRLSPPTGQ